MRFIRLVSHIGNSCHELDAQIKEENAQVCSFVINEVIVVDGIIGIHGVGFIHILGCSGFGRRKVEVSA